MSFKVQRVKLVDLCTDVSYGYTASAETEAVGPKFLRITDIQGGVVDWNRVPYCKASGVAKVKNELVQGDIVIARTGNSTGENYYFDVVENAVFASYLIRFRVNAELANPYFVWLQLRTQSWWDFISSSKSGSAQAGANARVMGQYEINLPTRAVQDQIEKVFRNLNNKLQLNHQINQTLESIAQALFKSWFVDFDPVKAKIDVLENGGSEEEALLAAMRVISSKSAEELAVFEVDKPEEYAQLRETAELFPNAMMESELGEIPEGWKASVLGEHFNIVMGQSPKGDTYNENGQGMLFFQGRRDFGFRYPKPRVYTTDPKRLAQAGDTLISVRAPVGDRNMAAEECCLGRGVAGLRHKSGSRSFTYAFIGHIEKKLGDSSSEGTVFSSINKRELERIDFIAPNEELVVLFEQFIYPIDQKIELLTNETESIETLRDTLLPKLLSGELDVSGMIEAKEIGVYIGK